MMSFEDQYMMWLKGERQSSTPVSMTNFDIPVYPDYGKGVSDQGIVMKTLVRICRGDIWYLIPVSEVYQFSYCTDKERAIRDTEKRFFSSVYHVLNFYKVSGWQLEQGLIEIDKNQKSEAERLDITKK